MDAGLLITRITAMVAFAAYVIALLVRMRRGQPQSASTGRAWWTAGSLLFVVHVICAFHFIHHWSHDDAYAATARQSAEVTGFDSGLGLYLNYAFTTLWLLDATWWWVSPQSYATRGRRASWTIHGFMAFMWFNATVIFGRGTAQWMGLAACVFGVCEYWRLRRSKN